jgi:quinate/shikimate dehydrogenase
MTERITGHTELIGLIATPIRHSLSPLMHNTAFATLGLDYAYLAFDIADEDLAATIQGFRALKLRGFNVSMPFKSQVCQYLDKLSPAAALIGAVNTVVNDNGVLTGHNTDGIGFMRSLSEHQVSLPGKKMTLLGAGGAATAIAVQAALDGVKSIAIFNKKDQFFANSLLTVEKIRANTACDVELYDMADTQCLEQQLSDSALLTNATGVGMKPLEGYSLLPEQVRLPTDCAVCDIIYTPAKTRLLEQAEQQGCRTFNGLGMMLWQGAIAFELWTGKKMPIDEIRHLFF